MKKKTLTNCYFQPKKECFIFKLLNKIRLKNKLIGKKKKSVIYGINYILHIMYQLKLLNYKDKFKKNNI